MNKKDVLSIKLMKNSVAINGAYRTAQNIFDMVSNSAVLQLSVGDQVWLRMDSEKVVSDGDICTAFSGVILHEM